LVKREHAEAVSQNLPALRGKTVNLSKRGSGTYTLATKVMEYVGLKITAEGGDCKISDLSYGDMLKETERDRLPDAVFTVSLMPSPLVKHLITRHNYCLVPLPFRKAVSLDSI